MDYLYKASLVIVIFYVCYALFLRKVTFFQHNRWFLLLGLVFALIFPFVIIPIEIPIEATEISYPIHIETAAQQSETIQYEQGFNWLTLLPFIYGLGFCVFISQFILQFGSLALLLLKNPKQKEGFYTYVIIKNKISPFSFFKWIVYNPESYSEEELTLILEHEKVHVNQYHSLDIIFTQLMCTIFWFNPCIWFYKKDVKQNLEYIADNTIIKNKNNDKQYQRLLLKTSIANHNMAMANNFYNSLIKKRIVMLQKSKTKSVKKLSYILVLPILVVLLLSMNTKEVYVEKEPIVAKEAILVTENTNTIEFIVTKHTTDAELDAMSKSFADNGGTLVFKDIKRNEKNELVNIFVKLYNHSYGGGDSKTPINSFIIYKELYGNGGGFVGRPNAATLHFDKPKLEDVKEEDINSLKARAVNAMRNLGLTVEPKTQRPAKKKPALVKTKTKKIIKPAKIKTKSKKSTTIEFVITKNTTDTELKSIKNKLELEGLTLKIKGVKRNNKGEITAIKIDAKSENSNSNYNIKSDNVIKPITISYNSNNERISIGNNPSKGNYVVVNGTNVVQHKILNGDAISIITEDSNNDAKHKIIVNSKATNGSKVKVVEGHNIVIGKNMEVITEDGNNENHKIIINGKATKDGKIKVIGSPNIVRGKKVEIITEEDNDDNVKIIIEEEENESDQNGTSKKRKFYVQSLNNINQSMGNDNGDIIMLNTDNKIELKTNGGKSPLIMVDGKEISREELMKMDSDNFETVTILKNKAASELYGEKAKDGVIVIKTK